MSRPDDSSFESGPAGFPDPDRVTGGLPSSSSHGQSGEPDSGGGKIPYWILAAGTTVVIMVVLAAILSPQVIRARERTPLTGALSNMRQVGLAMFEFETEYGSFPDAGLSETIKANTGNTWNFGKTTSNDFFRQLLASNIASSEVIFHAQTRETPVKPDNRYGSDAEALKKRECSFTYLRVPDGTAAGRTKRPLVVVSMKPGTRLFDPKPFEGRAVILWSDNSVGTMPIEKDGRVILDGRDMMDPLHPVWNGRPPVIAWPDL